MFRLAICLCVIGSLLSAQTLSPSEQAAVDQVAPDQMQIAQRNEECSLQGLAQREPLVIASGAALPVLDWPETRLLVLQFAQTDNLEAGTVSMSAFPPLPFGGIAGFDFCNVMIVNVVSPPERVGEFRILMGLRLRRNLDLAVDYPNTSQTIADQGQISVIPESPVVVANLADPSQKSWLDAGADGLLAAAGQFYSFNDLALIPLVPAQ
ncbi:hypothetical protein AB3Y40_10135 [Yoonia sp. R2331]|uniref:hypothetical protein n=1 Tax=Yoonia sp. R2331 TaxID=3237238 RepID=UPI0034E38247